MDLYKYLFYWIYKKMKKVGNWYVERSAHYIVTLIVMINVLSLGLLYEIYVSQITYFEELLGGVFIFVFILNYAIFIHKKEYLNIIKHFDQEKKKDKKIVIVLAYLLISFLGILITISLKPR